MLICGLKSNEKPFTDEASATINIILYQRYMRVTTTQGNERLSSQPCSEGSRMRPRIHAKAVECPWDTQSAFSFTDLNLSTNGSY